MTDDMMAWARMADPWSHPGVRLNISPDPLGPVNKIFTLERNGDIRIGKSVLYPMAAGAKVSIGEDGDSWIGGIGWRTMMINGDLGGEMVALKPRVWFVEVNDRRILEVPWGEALLDPTPVPKMPWYRKVRWSIRNWRAYHHRITDRIAHRLGYQRIGECDCDEY